jgi:class 3 adenylate cyclase
MAKLIQASITAEGYVAYRRDNRLTSVTAELNKITSPTLVVVTENDEVIPTELSQEVAARIPNARFHLNAIGFSSQDILAPGARSAFYLNEVTTNLVLDFLRPEGEARPRALEEVVAAAAASIGGLRTVLFTDIVGHTEMMQRLGDTKGRDVLREHERITRETLAAHGGAEVKTMGDGFMASFGSVTAAVECAIALQCAFATHTESTPEPLHVRVGLNAGEPIEEDGDLFGATVILASRIAATAGAGEILIPEPVRHLLSGKSFVFSDRGEYAMKGFDDAVRLYEVRWQP